MWRALFLAVGIYGCMLGAQCLVIDKAVLNQQAPSTSSMSFVASLQRPRKREFVPPEWAPWTLVSFGVVTLIYSFTIPKRVSG